MGRREMGAVAVRNGVTLHEWLKMEVRRNNLGFVFVPLAGWAVCADFLTNRSPLVFYLKTRIGPKSPNIGYREGIGPCVIFENSRRKKQRIGWLFYTNFNDNRKSVFSPHFQLDRTSKANYGVYVVVASKSALTATFATVRSASRKVFCCYRDIISSLIRRGIFSTLFRR